MEKLVSVLTPCYNGEKFIWRLLDSILNQTYPRIEMFVIDDGSTDSSSMVIQSYIPKFATKGYLLTYVYQENAGQSVAINNGLKLIKGDYLVWPDCDDWYAVNDAIEQMVATLDSSGECVSMVRCQAYLLDENTFKRIGRFCVNIKTKGKTNLFEDCMFVLNGYWFGSGNYMAKTKKIEENIPRKEIHADKDAGQNWQLMLPLFYKSECLTIENFLYNVLRRNSSHSRGLYSTLEQQLQRYNSYEKTLLTTIDNIANMSIPEREKYRHDIQIKYQAIRFSLFISFKRYQEAKNMFFTLNLNSKKKLVFIYLKNTAKKIARKILAKSTIIIKALQA